MFSSFAGQKVLFITTKSTDYIRNSQEIDYILKSNATLTVIGSTASNYLGRLSKVYTELLSVDFSNFDIIFIGFAPQLVLPLFKRRLLKSKATIIIDFFVSMYDTFCLDRKRVSPEGIIGRLFHHIDTITLHLADRIICDTNAHGEFFVEEFGTNPNKLSTVYLEADTRIYRPLDIPRPKELQDKFVVLYFGTGLPLQGTDIVLEAFHRLGKNDRIQTVFIGHITNKLQQAIIDSTPNLTHIDWLSQEELNIYINYADLCLAGHFSKDIDKAKRTIPGKAYIYDAIKKPMILGNTPANHEQFDDNNPNYIYVPLGNSEALSNTILQFFAL